LDPGCGHHRKLGLLASSSIAALLIAGGAPAWAACTSVGSGGYNNTTSVSGLCVTNTSFSGNIDNTGTISPSGIKFTNGSITGKISSSGTIVGGISLDVNSKIISAATAILINGPTFTGGISNAGTVSGGGFGIYLYTVKNFSGGISNSGHIAANTAAIDVFGGSSFGGGISNSGTISAGITGIIANGMSTFTGGISNSGTISASSGNGIDVTSVTFFGTSANGGITNSGTISAGGAGIYVATSITQFGNTSGSGGIVNSGTIIAGHTGIFAGGISTFAGGISNSGTISAGSHGIYLASISTFLGGITNSGTITVSAGVGIQIGNKTTSAVYPVSTFSGNISNSGTIVAKTGILIDSGSSFAPGSAIINSGTIIGTTAIDASNATSAVIIDQTGGLISGAIKLSAYADQLNISGGTIAGNIVGQGSSDTINFNMGSGTFTYGAAYSFTGINQVNVKSGTVILDGAGNSATNVEIYAGAELEVGDAANTGATLTSTNTIDDYGTLAGHGTVDANVAIESGGTLSPGGSIGTLTINGNLTFNSGGNYAIEIASPYASMTQVNGTATLNNGASVTALPTELGSAGARTYLILHATTLSGSFNPNVAISQADLTSSEHISITGSASLSYDSNDVYLSMPSYVITLVAPANAPANAQNVTNAINQFILAGGTVPAGLQNLANLSGNALDNALNQLAGQPGGAFVSNGFNANTMFMNMVMNPFIDGRGGFGFGPSFASIDNGPALAYADDPIAASANRAFQALAPPRPLAQPQLNFWSGAYGGVGATSGNAATGSASTNSQIYGVLVGVDDHLSPNTMVGLALGGGGTGWQLGQGLGSGHSGMAQASLYGSQRYGPAYISGALAYGFNAVTTSRLVTLAGSDTLAATFDANTVSSRIEGGYRLPANLFGVALPKNLGITPYTALQAQAMFLPAYSEYAAVGSSQFALSYMARDYADIRTEVGAWFDFDVPLDLPVSSGALKLYSKLAYAHDFENEGTAIAAFQQLPGASFLINATRPASDNALVTTGLEYKFSDGWSLIGKFDGSFSANTEIYAGTGMIRKVW
jgi:uncharacterized protein with beta-barrel porin domain